MKAFLDRLGTAVGGLFLVGTFCLLVAWAYVWRDEAGADEMLERLLK